MGFILIQAPSWMQLLSLATCSYGTAAEVKTEPSATKGRGRTVKCGKGIGVGALAKGVRWALCFGRNEESAPSPSLLPVAVAGSRPPPPWSQVYPL